MLIFTSCVLNECLKMKKKNNAFCVLNELMNALYIIDKHLLLLECAF